MAEIQGLDLHTAEGEIHRKDKLANSVEIFRKVRTKNSTSGQFFLKRKSDVAACAAQVFERQGMS